MIAEARSEKENNMHVLATMAAQMEPEDLLRLRYQSRGSSGY